MGERELQPEQADVRDRLKELALRVSRASDEERKELADECVKLFNELSGTSEPDPRLMDIAVNLYASTKGVDLEKETKAGPDDASYRRVAGSYEGGKKR